MVVTLNTGVTNGVPVPRIVPVVEESANHFSVVPVGAVALNDTVPAPQLVPLTDTVTAVGNALYVATTAVRVAETQVPEVLLAAA